MAFQMGFTKEELSGAPPVPAGWYTLQFKGFKPKQNKNKDGVNLNAEFAIVSPTEYEGRRVFHSMSSKMAFMWGDFSHAMGLPLEPIRDGNEGTEKEQLTLPGAWEGMEENPDDPTKWKYVGPLTNKTFEAELADVPAKDGFKAKNEIRQFKCAIEGCIEKHSTNLVRE